ncbi:unnamed protein product [Lampetra fluviatilis]
MLLHGGIGRAAQPSLSANCGNLRSSASSRHFARRERRAKFGRHCQLGGKRFPPNLNFRWHFFQSALLSLAHATYPRMEQMALDSLSLERLLSLAQEMSVSLPATKEDDLKSLKQYRQYLYGRQFVVRMDHVALQNALRDDQPSGQLSRWTPGPDTRGPTGSTVHRWTEDNGTAVISFFFLGGAMPIRPFTYRPGGPQEAHSCPTWGPGDEDPFQNCSVSIARPFCFDLFSADAIWQVPTDASRAVTAG